MNFVISQEIRDAVMNYLATQPYRQVAQLINAMAQLPEEKKKKDGKDTPS